MHHPTQPRAEDNPGSTLGLIAAAAAGIAAATTFLAVIGVAARALGLLP
ncbi:hypothetical protein [Janibacter terrae]|nr:hypothetical protein [Janibacter terrae]